MVDETPVVAEAAAPDATVDTAPVIDTTTEAPVVDAAPEAAPTETTLLGEAKDAKPETDSPTDAPKEGEEEAEPTDADSQTDDQAPPEAPVYDPFELPEGLTLDPERAGKFTSLLGEYEVLAGADHAKFQEFGQKLVEFHIAEVQQTVDNINRYYTEHWQNTKQAWHKEVTGWKDYETTVNAALGAINALGDEDAAALRQMMDQSGYGNNPVLIKAFAKLGQALGEGAKMVPAAAPPAKAQSKLDIMYGPKD